jgi:TetR/AcrR family transcriptional regulator, fatty acid metabolism regulator protein
LAKASPINIVDAGGDNAAQHRPEARRPKKRARSADRQRQVAEVTLRLIARHGLPGVRLAEIADEIGVTDAALYKHFASKEDILIAAYDLLVDRAFEWIATRPGATAIERLQSMGETHASTFSRDVDGFNVPMSQFNVWIPQDRIRSHVDQMHRAIMDAFVRLLEEGKAEGCVKPDVDSEVIVSELYAWIWWEDLSHLRGLDPASIAKGSAEMFNRIVADVAVAPVL